MRYIAIIPAAVLVVAFAVVLIGSPFSTDYRNDLATNTPPVLSVAETPADVVASPFASVDATGDPPLAAVTQASAKDVEFVELTAGRGEDAVAEASTETPRDVVTVAGPTGEETDPAIGDQSDESRDACVPRSQRPARRFRRCR